MSIFYVCITTTKWVSLLREDYNNGTIANQVNFWTPGTQDFKVIEPGDLFLFKLHNSKLTGENGEIVGGGYFVYYDRMSIPEAWQKFGRANGRESLDSMLNSIKAMREKNNIQSSVKIGCIILEKIFFFNDWIPEPTNWSKRIIKGKKYSTDTEIGLYLFNAVNERISGNKKSNLDIVEEIEKGVNEFQLKGEEKITLINARVNQSVFRERLLKKYHTCCLCKVENQALLKASHIKPWVASNADEKLDVENGFLFCPNHDALFDGGFISFDDNGNIIISNRLSPIDCTFSNVVSTMKITLSEKNRKYLEYHRQNVFY